MKRFVMPVASVVVMCLAAIPAQAQDFPTVGKKDGNVGSSYLYEIFAPSNQPGAGIAVISGDLPPGVKVLNWGALKGSTPSVVLAGSPEMTGTYKILVYGWESLNDIGRFQVVEIRIGAALPPPPPPTLPVDPDTLR